MNTEYLLQLPVRGEMPTHIEAIEDAAPITWGYQTFDEINGSFGQLGGNKRGGKTLSTDLRVFGLMKQGTLAEIYGSFGKDLLRLAFELGQIEPIVAKYYHWFVCGDHITFFLFAHEGTFHAAGVAVRPRGLPRLSISPWKLTELGGVPPQLNSRFVIPKQ